MAQAKIDLDPQGPVTFKREVEIAAPSGKAIKVEFEFLHRNREEMALLQNGYSRRAQEARDKAAERSDEKEEQKSLTDEEVRKLAADATKLDVEAIMDVAVGWNLMGYIYNVENLSKFCNRYQTAGLTILSAYNRYMTEGRLGN